MGSSSIIAELKFKFHSTIPVEDRFLIYYDARSFQAKTVLAGSFYTFADMGEVLEIVVVCDPAYRDIFEGQGMHLLWFDKKAFDGYTSLQ